MLLQRDRVHRSWKSRGKWQQKEMEQGSRRRMAVRKVYTGSRRWRKAEVECDVGGGLNDLEGGGLTTPIVAIGRA